VAGRFIRIPNSGNGHDLSLLAEEREQSLKPPPGGMDSGTAERRFSKVLLFRVQMVPRGDGERAD
jgi:hypothetical protein